jgi:hypothetical protein
MKITIQKLVRFGYLHSEASSLCSNGRYHVIIGLGFWAAVIGLSDWAVIIGLSDWAAIRGRSHRETVISILGPISFHSVVSNGFCL